MISIASLRLTHRHCGVTFCIGVRPFTTLNKLLVILFYDASAVFSRKILCGTPYSVSVTTNVTQSAC